jgi:tol-pal system protein YbgF
MKWLSPTVALGLLCALFVVAPLHAADREHQQMMADIRMLQEQAGRLNQMLGALDQTLQTLLVRLDDQNEDRRRAFADQRLMVDNVAGGVRIVREKVDETNVRVSSLAQEVEALRMAIPPMGMALTELEVDPETGEPIVPAVSFPAAASVNPGVSPRRLYDTAYADYTTGQWALSIQGFEAYISSFPQSELADDAQFFIGQNYYADGQFREAAEAFQQVELSYPTGDVVPEALYKRGLTLERLDETELARDAFELVVEQYPDDNMANLAQQALDRAEP